MKDLQDYTQSCVPENAGPRFKWLYLTNVENAVTVCVPVFMFGAFLGTSMNPVSLLLALCLGGIFLALFSSWSSYIGVKTRLSTALLVRRSFGVQGAKIVWLILGISLFGWFGVQTELFAKAFMALLQKTMPSLTLSPVVVTIVAGALMSSTAIVGIKGVGKLAQAATPLLLLALGWALYAALSIKGFSAWWSFQPEKPVAVGAAVAAIVGGYSVGAIVMPDIKRFALNAKHSILSAILGLGFFYPFLLFLTALATVLSGQSDFMELLSQSGLGAFSLVILMLATWTTNDLNLYSASLNLSPILPRLSRPWLTAVCGAVGTGFSLFGFFEHLTAVFALMGVFSTPLFAIYSFDFLTGKFSEDAFEQNDSAVQKINIGAFVCWGLASFVGVITTPVEQLGGGVFEITTVPCLDSLLIAVVFLAARFLLRKKSPALCCSAENG